MPSTTDAILSNWPSGLRSILLFPAASTIIEDLLCRGSQPINWEEYRYHRFKDSPRTPIGFLNGDIPTIGLASMLRQELMEKHRGFKVSSGTKELSSAINDNPGKLSFLDGQAKGKEQLSLLRQLLGLKNGEEIVIARFKLSFPQLDLSTRETCGYPTVSHVFYSKKIPNEETVKEKRVEQVQELQGDAQAELTRSFYTAAAHWPVAEIIGEQDLRRLTGGAIERR